MADAKATIPPDSTGKNIDLSEVTRVDGTVVERQRIVVADNSDASSAVPAGGKLPNSSSEPALYVKAADLTEIKEILLQLLAEMRLHRLTMAQQVAPDTASADAPLMLNIDDTDLTLTRG